MSSDHKTKLPLVLYHDNCTDGFVAAWAAHYHFKGQVEMMAISYDERSQVHLPGLVADRDVYILDFSFAPEQILTAANFARSITLLDHHKTAMEEWENINFTHPNLVVMFDMGRSGAGMAWDFFFPNDSRPSVVDRVEDRDLYRFKINGSRELHAYLAAQPWRRTKDWDAFTQFVADYTFDDTWRDQIHAKGAKYISVQDEIIYVILKNTIIMDTFRGYSGIPFCCVPDQFATRAGEILYQTYPDAPFTVTYDDIWTRGTRKYSLRNDKDNPIDVGVVARTQGGGGHEHAAGWTEPLTSI